MALGPLPTLTEINIELTITSASLGECIAYAERGNIWSKQSDFANYTYNAISISSSSITIPSTQVVGVVAANITATVAWEVAPGIPSWLEIIPMIGSDGVTSVYISADENIGIVRNYTAIFIDTVGNQVTLNITQESRPALSVNPSIINVSSTAQLVTTYTELNDQLAVWEMYSITQTGNWITHVAPLNSQGDTEVRITVEENTLAVRDGFVNFRLQSDPAVTASLVIIQSI